jgi:uncharacterized protein involved in exopolysaccharide biosynthesis
LSRLGETRVRVVAFVDDPRQRRLGYLVVALILAILCLFPQPYVARAKVLPQDASSIGLGSMMGAIGAQFQGIASLFGGARQPTDMYLAISRSTETTDEVIRQLKLVGPNGYASLDRARLALDRKVDIHSLTGGLIEIEVRTHDSRQAEVLTRAYVRAISDRLSALGRDRVERKRRVVRDRFREAAGRVAIAEARLNEFRRQNRIAAPEAQLGSALTSRARLEAELQAKEVALQTAQQFRGPESPQLQALQTEIASVRAQLARTTMPAEGAAGPNVAGLTEVSGEYLDLYRDYRFAQALYDVYARSSEEVAVELLAEETATDVQLVEAPRLDADRKVNIYAVALLALVVLTAFFTEVYAPATGIALRVGRRTGQDT